MVKVNRGILALRLLHVFVERATYQEYPLRRCIGCDAVQMQGTKASNWKPLIAHTRNCPWVAAKQLLEANK